VESLRAAPACCQEHAEQIAALEHRIAEMEQFFAILQGATSPARSSARKKAAEAWGVEAS
jgi:hypothetical protein